jgi:hypothetical protein
VQICVAGAPIVGLGGLLLLLTVGLLPQVRVLAVILVLQRSCQGLIIPELWFAVPDRARLCGACGTCGTCGTWHVVGRRRSIPGHAALAVRQAVSKLRVCQKPHSLEKVWGVPNAAPEKVWGVGRASRHLQARSPAPHLGANLIRRPLLAN